MFNCDIDGEWLWYTINGVERWYDVFNVDSMAFDVQEPSGSMICFGIILANIVGIVIIFNNPMRKSL